MADQHHLFVSFLHLQNCIGRHHFDSISKIKLRGAKTNVSDKVEEMNLNGMQRVTQEHQQLLEQTRRRLRDRISSQMGELLLLGYTMLNEYCELCAGILMEDRQGVRSCIACDIVNREFLREQSDRSPVSNNDDHYDLDDTAHVHSNMSRRSEVLEPAVQFLSTDSSTTCHVGFPGSRNVKMAIEAVEDKLKWCAERLKNCENVEEVMKLYETIDRGIGILKISSNT